MRACSGESTSIGLGGQTLNRNRRDNTMAESPDPLEALVPGGSKHPVVKYAKWGLIGIGTLVVLRWALALLLNPMLLVLGGVGGVVAYTMLKKKPESAATGNASARSDAMPTSSAEMSDDPVKRSEAELEAFDRRLAEIERLKRGR